MKARGIHPTRESYQTPPERKFCKLFAVSVPSFARKSKAEKYSNEAFSFHEKKWKRNKEGMSKHDRIAILTTLVHMATSQMKEKKKQKYESLLKVWQSSLTYQCMTST